MKLRLLRLFAPRGKFRIDSLNRLRSDALEVFSRSGGELIQIKCRQPSAGTRKRPGSLVARRVGKVPYLVDFNGRRIEPRVGLRLGLQSQSADARHRLGFRRSF